MLRSRTTYCRVSKDGVEKYSGFKAKGTNKSITPNTMSKSDYVTIVQGLPETLFDEESHERSEFSSRLENTMKAQAFNNPVLVYYNIK